MAGSYSQNNSTSYPGMVPGMLGVYNQLLQINQGRYQNVLNAFQGGLAGIQQGLGGIYGGYDQLMARVLGTLGLRGGGWGVAAPAATAIERTMHQQAGKTQQQMIDAGLGNTTVGQNLAQQNAMYASEAYGSLGAQLAQTAAGYETQIGMAGLGARMQGLGLEANYITGSLGALGQQATNTAGSLTGTYGSSSSFSSGGDFGGGGGGSHVAGGYGGGVSGGGQMDLYPPGYGPRGMGPGNLYLSPDAGGSGYYGQPMNFGFSYEGGGTTVT